MTSSIATLEGHKDRVWSAVWNPKGTLLASCGSDKSIRIWGKQGVEWINKIVLSSAHSRTVRSIAWSPCGNFFASASFDSTINIWEHSDGDFTCIATLEGHDNEVKCVTWSASGSHIATCSRDKSVWVWEIGEDQEYECISVLPSHSQDVKKVLFDPTGISLASASYDNTVKFYEDDGDDWVVTSTLDAHSSTVWSLCFNADGSRMATCSDDKTVKIWQKYPPGNPEGIPTVDNISAWKPVSSLSGFHERAIYDIAWCPQTGLIATACGDDSIKVFQEHSSDYLLILNIPDAHSEDVNSVHWNPTVKGLLASTSDDGTVKLWDFSSLV